MVLGPAVRGTTGPRTTCPGGQFFGGTSGPATPSVRIVYGGRLRSHIDMTVLSFKKSHFIFHARIDTAVCTPMCILY